MSQNTQATSGGTSLCTLLLLLFIGLKLTGHITWSWFWVLSPFWIPVTFAFSALGVILLVAGVAHLLGK